MCCYWNLCIYTLLLCCSDNVVNAVWPQTVAGSLVSAVARGRETNSKDRQHRRWQQQKKTFNICCLKAVSLLPSNVSPFVVAEPDVSTGQNNITLQTGSLKQAKAVVSLLLRKSFAVLKGCSSVYSVETYFPCSLTANFHSAEKCSTIEFPLLSPIFPKFYPHRQTLCIASILLLYLMNNLRQVLCFQHITVIVQLCNKSSFWADSC